MTAPIALYGTEHALTVCAGDRIAATAVATGFGWHISLGRIPHGPERKTSDGQTYQPTRCHWWTARSRDEAIQWLRYLGVTRPTRRA